MPLVKRTRPATYSERYEYSRETWTEYKPLPWKELTKKEVAKAVSIRASIAALIAGVVIGSLPNGPVDFWGDTPTAADRTDQVATAVNKGNSLFNGLTLDQKFALLYLTPAQVEVSGDVGGNGILGIVGSSDGSDLHVNVGQNCLKGKAYDTGASYVSGLFVDGEFSAVASLSVLDNVVSVHPAGSDAPALVFAVDETGMLVADEPTAQTLEGYGCEVGLGMYEETSRGQFSPLEQ